MRDNDAPLLLDVSRLVWRRWTGTRPTGIDRICLAWLDHYAAQAQAVVIHRYGKAILPQSVSQTLFRILQRPERSVKDATQFRAALAALALRRGLHLRDHLDGRGRLWLNPGHTGLDASGIADWCDKRDLRPVHLIHDLIPITHPQFCRDGEQERHRRRMLAALATGCGVVANSAHTLETLAEFAQAENMPLPPAIIAWPGTPHLPVIDPQPQERATFVVLGTIEGRKNHRLLLAVWQGLLDAIGADADPSGLPQLVIVGRRGWQADDIFAMLDNHDFRGLVSEAGPLDDAGLAEVLAGARALLFPSLAEGFGIPLTEALAAGVPVIASDLPVFREIGQGVPELLPPTDHAAWTEAILDYATPASVRRAAQLARINGFQTPNWGDHFAQIDNFLKELGA
ncbi:MAG: glycosyltransferase family 1 protein [Erythrobacter sp.]|nr:glycosyltransferase family 1 protein [Erythrobacter sp.]